ncbi:MAG: amino acid--tRNA ligase-related protein, partial [Pseudomonadota bacterium]
MSDAWEPSCSLEALEARAELLTEIRSFFRDRQVLEVQTALIAEHTVTDLHIDSLALTGGSFLQTSPEYQLKRLLAAGAPSLYQLAPVFRAGEQGRLHNPEFTLLEWYRLGFDDEALRVEVAALVDQVLGPAPYQTISYAELLQGTGATPDRSGSETDPDALDLAFAEATAALRGRWFITRYPAAQAALARLCA